MKTVDCHVLRSIELLEAVSTVVSLKFRSIFDRDDQFVTVKMVKLSSLHDEGRPADVLYRYRRDTLVNALRMVVISLILGVSSLSPTFWLGSAGTINRSINVVAVWSPPEPPAIP